MAEGPSTVEAAENRRQRRAGLAVGFVFLASNLTFLAWATLREEWPVVVALVVLVLVNGGSMAAARRGLTRVAGYTYALTAMGAVVAVPMLRGHPGHAAFYMVVGLMLGAVILPARDVLMLYFVGLAGELVLALTPVTKPDLPSLSSASAEGTVMYLVVGLVGVAMAASIRQLVDDLSRRDEEARAATRRAEELARQLEHSQRMEALGRLAGGIAHDFNNLLTVMQSCSSLLASQLGDKDGARQDLADLDDAIGRATSLTKQLLAFARRDVMPIEAVDLGSLIDRMTDILRRLLGSGITLEVRAPGATCFVQASPSQLEQIFLNLAVNARDAMGGTGRLVVALEHRGRECVLTVQDTGPGLSGEAKVRVFEPFFTTKGHGTGLGLSTVYGIVTRLDGRVSVDSAPGQGTTFRIVLPTLAPPAEPQTTGRDMPSAGSLSVLIVDDEPVLREQLVRMLVGAGHRAQAVGTAEEALAQRPLPDVLVTDVQLGADGRTGVELAEKLLEHTSRLRVVLVSGYTAEPSSMASLLARGATFLSKPFTADALLAAVRGEGVTR